MEELRKKLFLMKDEKYKDFCSKLIPTINKEKFIGVRTSFLRSLAKEIYKTNEHKIVLNSLPHYFYEENQLHSFIIEQINDFNLCIKELEKFLPYMDNWSTCDSCRPKILKKNSHLLKPMIEKWINTKDADGNYVEFTVRFGVNMLMSYFLDKDFDKSIFEMVSSIKSDKYYINMMIAWFFSTALAKQWKCTYEFLQEENKLSLWIRKKIIQKAKESYRISDDNKLLLGDLLK